MKINETQLRDIIAKAIKESVFGMNGQDFEHMGLKNPANDYPVNKEELGQKTEEFLKYLKSYMEYIGGVEEDAEKGIKGTTGAYVNMQMHGSWNNDEDETSFAEDLREVYFSLNRCASSLEELVDYYCYHN